MQLIDLYRATFPDRNIQDVGKEYHCSCPYCGPQGQSVNVDRFIIDKAKNVFYCRQCQTGGGIKKFIADFGNGASQSILDQVGSKTSLFVPKADDHRPASNYKVASLEQWTKGASDFLKCCQNNLSLPDAQEFLRSRYISMDTARLAGLGYNSSNKNLNPKLFGIEKEGTIWLPQGMLIPVFADDVLRSIEIRLVPIYVSRSGNQIKWLQFEGSSQDFSFVLKGKENIVCVFESRFDAMLAWQTSDHNLTCIALSGSTKPIGKNAIDLIENAQHLFCAIDTDKAGVRMYEKIKGINQNAKLVPASGGKDLTDCHSIFLAGGNADSAESWYIKILKLCLGPQKENTSTSEDATASSDDAKSTSTIDRSSDIPESIDDVVNSDDARQNIVQDIWDKINWNVDVLDNFGYIKENQIRAYGEVGIYNGQFNGKLPDSEGFLLVPLQDINKRTYSYLAIHKQGGQYVSEILNGTNTKGYFLSLGTCIDNLIIICVGYDTGCTILESYKRCQVFCAFDHDNLPIVGKTIHENFPNKTIIIACDNVKEEEKQSNIGIYYGMKTAIDLNCLLAMPDAIENKQRTTFNDTKLECGLGVVANKIHNVLRRNYTYSIKDVHKLDLYK